MSNFINLGDLHAKIKEGGLPHIEFTDCKVKYRYSNFIDPSGVNSTKWVLSMKSAKLSDEAPWEISPGMLSNSYTVGKTEGIVDTIKKQLGGNTIGETFFRNGSIINYTFVLKGYEIKETEPDEVNAMMFKLLTGIDETKLAQESSLTFSVVNNMTGCHTLCMNYGFMTSLAGDSSKKGLSINNIYLLDEFQSGLVHDKKLALDYEHIQNVKENIITKINKFKETSVPDDFLESMKRKVGSRRIMKKVESKWAAVAGDLRNFYYLTYVISAVANSEKKIEFEIRSRKYISDFLTQLKTA